MPEQPFTNIVPCSICAERPGTLHMVVQTESGRQGAVMCESCARDLMEGFGQAGFGPSSQDDNAGFAAANGMNSPFGPGRRGAAAHADAPAPPRTRSETPALDEFGRDLTRDAGDGRIDPVIGREDEIAQTIEILARRRKNNAVLIGEAGVGKTAIVEGLALHIHNNDVPEALQGVRVVALDMGSLVAGSQYRGQFEQRLKRSSPRSPTSDGKIILFVDELHTVLGAGGAEGAMDAANLLKPMLARGELRMVGATTLSEFRKIERDAALARRFSPVTVDAPSVEETVEILNGLRSAYEEHHAATITDDALHAAARLSDRYLTEQHLPDKAIDLMDQAAAKLRLATPRPVDEDTLREQLKSAVEAEDYERAAEIKTQLAPARPRPADDATARRRARHRRRDRRSPPVVATRTGIPVGELVAGELQRLIELEDDLHQRVVGQDEAVEKVADTIRRARVGLERAGPAPGLVPVPRPHGRRQDRAGQGAVRAAVRHRGRPGPDRHVRVPRAAHGRAADRLAARLRRLRRRRPADRAGPAPSVQRDPARRDREGAPRGVERPAAAARRRSPDRRRGPHGGLHQRRDRDDVEPRRRARPSAASASPPPTRRARTTACSPPPSPRSCPSS